MKALIIGAGFGGIAAAVELKRHGIRDLTVLEKAPDYGGTWLLERTPEFDPAEYHFVQQPAPVAA